MLDSEVYTTLIEYMISESSNPIYIAKLREIQNKIRGAKHIEEHLHPRFQSIIIFGFNIFPFRIEDYREMINYIEVKHDGK